ncbi:MAG: SRPBCC family protein [Bacteroidota bacterium]
MEKSIITVEVNANAAIDEIWGKWTSPEHIIKWNYASDDWHCPSATNDLRVGGKFVYRMEAKDGSVGFDFLGIYDEVVVNKKISSTLGDGRTMNVSFNETNNGVKIMEAFEPESENSHEMQKAGWQMILDNFKKYAEK